MFKSIDEDELIKLLTRFFVKLQTPLYVVGGKVREDIMGLRCYREANDIDLCGALSLTKLIEFCEKNKLEYEIKSKKLEVIKIFCDGNEYEYARFRKENYNTMYTHMPSEVEFTEDLEEDSKRRDFTINAVYYDTHSKHFIDASGGIEDIRSKVVRACGHFPCETIMFDPARIIRMVELASRLNFKIDDETFSSAKHFAPNVLKLSNSRLKKEVGRLKEKNKYGENYDDYIKRVLNLLTELNLTEIMTI